MKAAESAPTQINTTQEPKASDAVMEAQRGSCSRDEEIVTDGKGTTSSLEAQTSQRRVRWVKNGFILKKFTLASINY